MRVGYKLAAARAGETTRPTKLHSGKWRTRFRLRVLTSTASKSSRDAKKQPPCKTLPPGAQHTVPSAAAS